MYSDKLKKHFFKKLCEYLVVRKKQEVIEKEIGWDWEAEWDNLKWNELISNEDYSKLDMQASKLGDEIDSLLVRTKFFPLVGLTDLGSQLLNIWKGTHKARADKQFEEKHIEEYLEEIIENLKNDMKEHSKQLEPLHLSAQMPPRLYRLYKQTIRCYLYGAFEACCVLCRAITESIAKKYIEDTGYGDLLVAKNKHTKTMSLQEILNKKLSVPIEIIEKFSKIANKADKILHEKDREATKEDASKVIQMLQFFINKFPRTI